MDFLSQFVEFFEEFYKSANSGYLFFGSTVDLIRSIADILIITLLTYFVIRFVMQSRAAQLIKGIIILAVFVFILSALGLQMVSFLFSRFLYIFAILFVVLFQPELRRILETVGIRSFMAIGEVVNVTQSDKKDDISVLIDEICDACTEMGKTYTGALILVERSTRLNELLAQENAVSMESSVSSTVLQSLFYKGAPMHDGAVLIRDCKIIGARCHVNSQMTLHKLERSGTRHKAAVAASEMGDTIAIAVSEERGKTSIAVNGRLYEMKNEDELKANLKYLFGIADETEGKKSITKALNSLSKKKRLKVNQNTNNQIKIVVSEDDVVSNDVKTGIKTNEKRKKTNVATDILCLIVSLLIAIGLWVYIQVDTNPVVTRHYVVPISYPEEQKSNELQISYQIKNVEVSLVGRQKSLDKISANDLTAYIDSNSVIEAGVVELPVVVESLDSDVYFRIEQQIPESLTITVYQ